MYKQVKIIDLNNYSDYPIVDLNVDPDAFVSHSPSPHSGEHLRLPPNSPGYLHIRSVSADHSPKYQRSYPTSFDSGLQYGSMTKKEFQIKKILNDLQKKCNKAKIPSRDKAYKKSLQKLTRRIIVQRQKIHQTQNNQQ